MKDEKNEIMCKTFTDDVQESFCVLPFVHTNLNTEGDVYPCCISWDAERSNKIGLLKDNTLEELFNDDKLQQLRRDLISGTRRPDVCVRCYTSEDNGFPAGRHGNNRDLQHMIPQILEDYSETGYMPPKIKSWDIRYSNLCNLKCRSCGGIYSTTWSKEDSEFYHGMEYREIKSYEGKDPLENQYEHVEKIYFAGGEPLIMPEHFSTLKKLIEIDRAKYVRLVYNTNMTKLNYDRNYLPDLWKEFKAVSLGLSIDNFGDRANYIRHGNIKWNKIEDNIKKMYEYTTTPGSNMDYFFSPTVSLLNVYTLTDLHRYLFENGMMVHPDQILLNILYHPQELSITILPDHIKEEISGKIIAHIAWLNSLDGTYGNAKGQFESLLSYIHETIPNVEEHVERFVKRTQEIDHRRNECFPDTFPEYAEWWQTITKDKIFAVNI